MQMTQRDVAILKFINEFGFCEIRHIAKQFGMTQSNCYALMKRLSTAKLVTLNRIYHQKHGVYIVTKKGAKYTELSHVRRIAEHIYGHHLLVIDIFQKILRIHPHATWISERWLLKEKYAKGFGKRGHIADGLVSLPDQAKPIAVEIELTRKGDNRVKRILNGYITNAEIGDVWYFCSDKTMEFIKSRTVKMPFVKLFDIEEFLRE
jgi:predicted transcriptional regulator